MRIKFGIIITLLGLCLASCGSKERELILLHTNDSHGSVLPINGMGGMAERATFIREVRQEYPYTLLVDAGDINTGQAISNMFNARPDIESYNYMTYDAVTAGNHEFDKPVDSLLRQMAWAQFPFVISNLEYHGKPLGQKYLIKEINGIKVGLFGITTNNTANISIYARDLTFKDEAETAREMVALLRRQNAEVVIGLVHLGFTETYPGFVTSHKLATEVEGIDILVDGHSHSYIEQPLRMNNTWIVTANESGRFVGKGKLKVKDGRLSAFEWSPVKISGFPPDTMLLRRLLPYREGAKRDLSTEVGEATETFMWTKDGVNLARYGETALGDLVADALQWKAGKLGLRTDFALTNSGGIRAELPAGRITKSEILSILPFYNELEIITMQGSDVRRLFEFIASVVPGNGAFAQVSKEVRVTYDRSAKQVKTLTIGGKPIDDKRTYHIATCDYVAAGKDGYEAGLGKINNREKTSRLLSDIVIEYIQTVGSITPRLDGRIQVTQ